MRRKVYDVVKALLVHQVLTLPMDSGQCQFLLGYYVSLIVLVSSSWLDY